MFSFTTRVKDGALLNGRLDSWQIPDSSRTIILHCYGLICLV